MRALLSDPAPAEFEVLLERRRWLGRSDQRYDPIARSGLIELSADDLADQLHWSAAEPPA